MSTATIPPDLSLDLTRLKHDFIANKSASAADNNNENNSVANNITSRTTSRTSTKAPNSTRTHKPATTTTHRTSISSNPSAAAAAAAHQSAAVTQRVKTTVNTATVLDHGQWTNKYDVRTSLQQYMRDFKSEIATLTTQLVHDAEASVADNTVDEVDLQLVQSLKQMELNFDSTIKQIDQMHQYEIDGEKQKLAAMGKNPNTVHSLSPRTRLIKEKAGWTPANNVYEQLSSKDLQVLLQIQQDMQSQKKSADKPRVALSSELDGVHDGDDGDGSDGEVNETVNQLQQYLEQKKGEEQKKQYDQYIKLKQRAADAERRRQIQVQKEKELEAYRQQYKQRQLEQKQSEADAAAYEAEEKRLVSEMESRRLADVAAEQKRAEQDKLEAVQRAAEQAEYEELVKLEKQRMEMQARHVAERVRLKAEQDRLEMDLKQRERDEAQAAKVARDLERQLKQLQMEVTTEKEVEALRAQLQAESTDVKPPTDMQQSGAEVKDQTVSADDDDSEPVEPVTDAAGVQPTPPAKPKAKSMKFTAEKAATSNNAQQFQTAKIKQSIYRR